MIKLDHINKFYGDLHVLKDVSLEVAEGEKLVIIGPSGSGKSTLLNIIAGKLKIKGNEMPASNAYYENYCERFK